MLKNKSIHLSKEKVIKMGSYYTPEILVNIVSNYIDFYKKSNSNVVLFDNAAGCGAFIDCVGNCDYRFADCDVDACKFLSQKCDENKVYCSNSLNNVSREKYNIQKDSFLIQIGNPPYNDTTSEFKKGEKGENICDFDLYDKDLGVSFLKSFNKLEANIVCVLHPLSYLIKETNFNRLREFKKNYILKKGVIFSSAMFNGTGSIKFPIVIALYERGDIEMTYDYIKSFSFSVLDSDKNFRLDSFETIDGYIHKYPPSKKAPLSSIGLYYYTIRDFNSLKKNTSFIDRIIPNGVVVEIDNFYKYAYLYALKELFMPDNNWLYGNLSPLVKKEILEQDKGKFVLYALKKNQTIKGLNKEIKEKIITYYNLANEINCDENVLENSIIDFFKVII
jgi:hypothetical protein